MDVLGDVEIFLFGSDFHIYYIKHYYRNGLTSVTTNVILARTGRRRFAAKYNGRVLWLQKLSFNTRKAD